MIGIVNAIGAYIIQILWGVSNITGIPYQVWNVFIFMVLMPLAYLLSVYILYAKYKRLKLK